MKQKSSIMTLKSTTIDPPIGWVFYINELGIEVKAKDYDELLKKIRNYFDLNKMSVPEDIEDRVHHYICLRIPLGLCNNASKGTSFRYRDLHNGTIALAIMLRRGYGALVPIEEAERRAKICASCDRNVNDKYCPACKGIESLIRKVAKDRTTKYDEELFTCGECKCYLKALVHVELSVLKHTMKDSDFYRLPSWCWKREAKEKKK
jgi:hypothetical protein